MNETENETVSYVTDFPIIILRSIWGFVNLLNEKSVITYKFYFLWFCFLESVYVI